MAYLDPNLFDSQEDSLDNSGVDQTALDAMQSVVPQQGVDTASAMALGGRQDSQKDARSSSFMAPNYAAMMNAQAAIPFMNISPYSSAMANAYSYGKRGLGALDPMIQAEQKILSKDYNSPWGILTKGVAAGMMGHDVGSMKENMQRQMMQQQNQIASLYGNKDMTPMQKAQALIASGNPTAAKLGSALMREEQMNRSQGNQDRNFQFKQQVQGNKDSDIAALAEQAVQSGYLDMKGMYGKGSAVKAYLQKNHPDFDVNQALFKTQAVAKQIQSLNGPQQTRLHQAISSVEQSIPEMAKLNQQFVRSGVIPLNKIIMGVRRNENGSLSSDLKVNTQGMTPDQVQIAQQFVTQMSIMRDETAQVFSGGYAPTEAAFHLADQVLNPFFGAKVTEAGLKQLGTNLKIRRDALSDVQAMVPSFNPATGSKDYFDPNDPSVISGGQGAPASGPKQLDQSTAAAILKQAKGDKAMARQIARQQGYQF